MKLPTITIRVIPPDRLEPGEIVNLRADWVQNRQEHQLRSAFRLADAPEQLPVVVQQLAWDVLEAIRLIESVHEHPK